MHLYRNVKSGFCTLSCNIPPSPPHHSSLCLPVWAGLPSAGVTKLAVCSSECVLFESDALATVQQVYVSEEAHASLYPSTLLTLCDKGGLGGE